MPLFFFLVQNLLIWAYILFFFSLPPEITYFAKHGGLFPFHLAHEFWRKRQDILFMQMVSYYFWSLLLIAFLGVRLFFVQNTYEYILKVYVFRIYYCDLYFHILLIDLLPLDT